MNKGFTLIELMVVIAVIAILATIALFGIGKAQAAARDVSRMQMMKGVQTALGRYYGDRGNYPKSGDAVPGGTTVCCNNFFNGMITALHQNNYLNITTWRDPQNGLVYTTFGGGDRFNYQSNWQYSNGPSECGGSGAWYNDYYTSSTVRYGYYTPDGTSYVLCLVKEAGGYSVFRSPQ